MKRRKIQNLLYRNQEELKNKMPARDFEGMWETYNNPNTRLTPSRMRRDMRRIESYLDGKV